MVTEFKCYQVMFIFVWEFVEPVRVSVRVWRVKSGWVMRGRAGAWLAQTMLANPPSNYYSEFLTRNVNTHSQSVLNLNSEHPVLCSALCSLRQTGREKERGKETTERDRVSGVYLFSCQLTVDNRGVHVHVIAFISRFIRPALGTVTSIQFPVKQLSILNKYCVICFKYNGYKGF